MGTDTFEIYEDGQKVLHCGLKSLTPVGVLYITLTTLAFCEPGGQSHSLFKILLQR